MTAAYLVRGDARRLPLADRSVQMICTSPPYFGLRSYGGQTSVWGGDPECSHTLAESTLRAPQAGYSDKSTLAGETSERTKGRQMATGDAWSIESRVLQKGTISQKQSTHKGNNGTGFSVTAGTCTLCGAWRGELGSEPTPALFVAHLVEVMRECWRVLRDDGVAFVNMGDGYSGSGRGPTGHNGIGDQEQRQGFRAGSARADGIVDGRSIRNRNGTGPVPGTRPKSLLLVPERLAIALSDDGWIVRSRIAWCKAAPMPESVRDRPTSAWEHIWMLTKGPRYFWDADAVREEAVTEPFRPLSPKMLAARRMSTNRDGYMTNAAGRNLWNYWLLPPDPYSGAHFATYPRELVRRCVAAATSEHGACAACGAPWKRETSKEPVGRRPGGNHTGAEVIAHMQARGSGGHVGGTLAEVAGYVTTTTGWTASCTCGPDAGVRPCVVLDPFSGSGTTAYVAASLGRVGVGVELSAAYTEQARYGRLAQDWLPL